MDVLANSETVTFNDMLQSPGLIQHVHGATHYLGHTLDLIITRDTDNIICSEPKIDTLISDHFSILADLNISKPIAEVKESKVQEHRHK